MITSVSSTSSVTVDAFAPALLTQRFRQGNPILPYQEETFEAVVIQFYLNGLETLAATDFPPSLERLPFIEEFYQNILSPFLYRGVSLTEMTARRITAIVPRERASHTRIIRTALVMTAEALATARHWYQDHQPILKNAVITARASATLGNVHMVVVGQDGQRQTLLLAGLPLDNEEKHFAAQDTWSIIAQRELLAALDNQLVPDASAFHRIPDAYLESLLELPEKKLRLPTQYITFTNEPRPVGVNHHIDEQLRRAIGQKSAYQVQTPRPTVRLILNLPHLISRDGIDTADWDEALNTVYQTASAYGGYCDHHTIYPNLGEIHLFFGTLGNADRIQRRAAGCALALNGQLGGRAAIRLLAHQAIAGTIGAGEQRAYLTVSQNNRPAPLPDLQPGRIVADEGVYTATQENFLWHSENGGYILLDDLSSTHSLPTRFYSRPYTPPYGRETALKALYQHLEAAINGNGRLLLIEGAAGMGKSTLIDTLIAEWDGRGGEGYMSVGMAYTPAPPYSAWLPIFRALLGLRPYLDLNTHPDQLAAAVEDLLPDFPQALPIFQNLLGLEAQEAAALTMLDAEVREKIVFDMLVKLIEQHARLAPLLLTFEHLDTLDTNSLNLLFQLPLYVENLPVLICLEAPGKPADWQTSFDPANTIRLDGWSEAAVRGYWDFQGVTPPPDFLPQEALTPLEAAYWGRLFKAAPDTPFSADSRLEPAFLETFSPEEQVILTRMGYWGMVFPPYVADVPRELVARLHAHNLIERYYDTSDHMVWERFRSGRFQAYLAGQVGDPASLAPAVLDFYQSRFRGPARAAMLLPYVVEETQALMAAQLHIMAGSHALRWGATEECLEHYARAESLLERHVPAVEGVALRVALLLGRADLHFQAGDYALSQADAKLAYDLASSDADYFSLTQALYRMAECDLAQGNATHASEQIERALHLAKNHQFADFMAGALWVKAQALRQLGRSDEAASLLKQAITNASRHNPAILQAKILSEAVSTYLENHQRDMAREYSETAMMLARSLSDPGLLQAVWAGYGRVQLLFGDGDTAYHACQEALRLTAPRGTSLSALAALLRDSALALCYMGRYGDAEPAFETAQEYLSIDGDEARQRDIDLWRAGEVWLDQERYEEVLALVEERLADPTLSPDMSLYARLTQATAYLRLKRLDRAGQVLMSVMQKRGDKHWEWYRPLWHLRLAEFAFITGNIEEATKQAYSSLGAVGLRSELRYLTPTYCLLAVCLYHASGDTAAVHDALTRAIRTGRSQGRKIHLAQALQLTGYYIRNVSNRQTVRARSSGYLYEAKIIFDELGLTPRSMWDELPEVFVPQGTK